MNTQKIEKLFKKDLILVELKSNNINQDTKENEKDTQNFGLTEEKNRNERIEKAQWKITIPKISLKAEISEGTSKEIMDKFVGHFEETTKTSGNVGLAAHNRGYAVNYFANIYAQKAILGASGLSIDGVSNADFEISETYKAMARRASETIIVADHSKIARDAVSTYLNWNQINRLIIDEPPFDDELIIGLKRGNVSVTVASDSSWSFYEK